MSDLSATNCGCNNSCSNNRSSCGFGGDNCCWIIILLLLCSGSGSGFGFNNNGCGDNNGCSCILWILILLSCCGNGF